MTPYHEFDEDEFDDDPFANDDLADPLATWENMDDDFPSPHSSSQISPQFIGWIVGGTIGIGAIAVLIWFLVAGRITTSPVVTTQQFYDAVRAGDFERAQSFVSPNSQLAASAIGSMEQLQDLPIVGGLIQELDVGLEFSDVEVELVEQERDHARVRVSYSLRVRQGENEFSIPGRIPVTHRLEKIDGAWFLLLG